MKRAFSRLGLFACCAGALVVNAPRKRVMSQPSALSQPSLVQQQVTTVTTGATTCIVKKKQAPGNLLSARQEVDLVTKAQSLMRWEKRQQELAEELGRMPLDDEWRDAVGFGGSTREFALARAEGRKAKAAMVAANLGLVKKVVASYRFCRGFEDLVQEGTYGLAQAVERFDVDRGHRFSTYAIWWIKQAVLAGVADVDDAGGGPRLPRQVRQRLASLKKAEEILEERLSRRPSDAELARQLGVRERTVCFLRSSASFKVPVSIDTPSHTGTLYSSNLLDPTKIAPRQGGIDYTECTAQPGDGIERSLMQDQLAELLRSTLTDKETRVLKFAFGLDGDGRPRTLDEVGRLCRVSKQNAFKTKHNALAKLRKSLGNDATSNNLVFGQPKEEEEEPSLLSDEPRIRQKQEDSPLQQQEPAAAQPRTRKRATNEARSSQRSSRLVSWQPRQRDDSSTAWKEVSAWNDASV